MMEQGKMRGRRVAACLLVAAAAALAVAGCKGGKATSELDRALASYRTLPADQQEPALRKAIADKPQFAKYGWYEIGNLYYARSSDKDPVPGEGSPTGVSANLDSALVCYQRAVDLDSTFVEPLVNMGLIWDDLSEGRTATARTALGKAKDLYLKAIALRPDDEKARCNLGALYVRRHQQMEALEQFNAVLASNPNSALAHYNLAIMFAESKMYREAMREWETAVKDDPKGDVGSRSRENIKVIKDLMDAKVPDDVKKPAEPAES